MDDKRLYLIAKLDAATQQNLTRLYTALVDAGSSENPKPSIPFHITMASFEPTQEAEVLARTKAVCAKTSPFSLTLSNIGLFGSKVLFIAPAINQELLDLHNALDPLEPAVGVHNWVAHVTMLLDEPEPAILSAVPIVARTFSPTAAKVESIAVYEYPPARFMGEFPLEG